MSVQRRKGTLIKIWPEHSVTDARGNDSLQPNLQAEPYVMRGAVIPQRSSRAEVPGQVEINVVRIIVDSLPADVGLFARVEMLGAQWDVASPPALHMGNRHTRHSSMDVRKRPGLPS